MLLNYLKTALRNFRKHRFYAIINLLGLAVGIACCLLIGLYVRDELSYDTHYPDSDRLYRVYAAIRFGDNEFATATTPDPLAEALRKDFPAVESVARIRTWGGRMLRVADSDEPNIEEDNNAWVDPEIFDVLGMEVVAGDPATDLAEPNTMALSVSAAQRYFPDGEALGKVMTVDNQQTYKIVGVYKDFPANAHVHLNVLFTMTDQWESRRNLWLSNNFHTYIRLHPGKTAEDIQAGLPEMIRTYLEPQVRAYADVSFEDFESAGNYYRLFIQPIHEIHFDTERSAAIEPGADIQYVYIFAAVALFILLIACINYMNLATARSASRALEVGVRKTLGSVRGQIITQFLTESTLLVVFAMLLGLLFVDLSLPWFNELANKALLTPWREWWFVPSLIGLGLTLGIFSGLYPAFFLSGFRPVQVLKGTLISGKRSGIFRSTLVVFQFATSIGLIAATLVVVQQQRYIQQKNIGFQKDQILLLDNAHTLGPQREVLRTALLDQPAVEAVAVSSFLPILGSTRSNQTYWREGMNIREQAVLMENWYVDEHYADALQITVTNGRFFSPEFKSDSQGVVLNETAVRRLGFEGDPIGQRIEIEDQPVNGEPSGKIRRYTVIGVVKNFHFESLKSYISPLAMFYGGWGGNLVVRLRSDELEPVLTFAEKKWQELAPQQPFDYSFMDERFARMYESEVRISNILGAFAILAILIACLGLLALSAFMAEQRHKEIGIRKVLGASVSQIVLLLSRNYLMLIGIALLIALPFSGWAMSRWLEEYVYRIQLSPWIFAAAGGIALLIALLTVSFQSWRAARSNPAESLRSE